MSTKQNTIHPAYNHLQRLAAAREMQEMDRRAIRDIGIPGMVLMENAARSVADEVEQRCLLTSPQSKIVVCCGKGNNGGDGFAIARLLKNRGYSVSVVDAGEAKTDDSRLNQKLWSAFGESVNYPGTEAETKIEQADIIIDAIFGTGLERDIEGMYREWIKKINDNSKAVKFAVDIPSGVHSDDSRIMGIAVKCGYTVTFQVGKQGCYQYPGLSYAGSIKVPDISIPGYWSDAEPPTYLLTLPYIRRIMPKRASDAHKGTYGHLLTVCGSAGMSGAAMLASYAAIKNGTGLVSACVPMILRDKLPSQAPEIMTLSAPANVQEYFTEIHLPYVETEALKRDAVVLGCGIGQRHETVNFSRKLVRDLNTPMVLDADGLNNITADILKQRQAPTIITPHPKELSRLCGLSTAEIQSGRIATVRRLAKEWNVVLVLKGAYTVIGDPSEAIFINPTGHEGMASGGSGDVLSGIIGSFLAQGCSSLEAAQAGVYLHGLTADCQKEHLNSGYLSAIDLIHGLNPARDRLYEGH